ncbi:MAG TPA: hypothetical protein VM261_38960 [Kofleriaceae bacterium]|nr:hypothetical protein [Kofleriaceae bacterium]
MSRPYLELISLSHRHTHSRMAFGVVSLPMVRMRARLDVRLDVDTTLDTTLTGDEPLSR